MRGIFWQVKANLAGLLPRKWLFYRGPKHTNKIALTFDDGPHPQHTPEVLAILAEHNIKASFFFIGEHIRQYPEITKQVYAHGHLIGGHGFSHLNAHTLTPAQFQAELDLTQQALHDTIGQHFCYFRPPYGYFGVSSLKTCILQNITTVLWSIDSRDFEQNDQQAIIDNITNDYVQSGDILLFHDNNCFTPQALNEVLSRLKNYDCVKVDALY